MHCFKLKPSLFYVCALCLLHGVAIAVVLLLHVSAVSQSLLLLCVVSSGIFAWRAAFYQSPHAVTTLFVSHRAALLAQTRESPVIAVAVLPQSVVTRFFMCLYLQPCAEDEKPLQVVVWYDSLTRAELRVLRHYVSVFGCTN